MIVFSIFRWFDKDRIEANEAATKSPNNRYCVALPLISHLWDKPKWRYYYFQSFLSNFKEQLMKHTWNHAWNMKDDCFRQIGKKLTISKNI